MPVNIVTSNTVIVADIGAFPIVIVATVGDDSAAHIAAVRRRITAFDCIWLDIGIHVMPVDFRLYQVGREGFGPLVEAA